MTLKGKTLLYDNMNKLICSGPKAWPLIILHALTICHSYIYVYI